MEAILLDITPWLQARPAVVADAEPLVELIRYNENYLRAFLPAVANIASAEDARALILKGVEQQARGELLWWHLFARDSLCGAVRLNHFEAEDRKASISYFVAANQQGQGIVTMSVRAILGYCFGQLDLNRVELRCVTTNLPSIKVAERLGFTREGELRQAEWLGDRYVNHYVYSLLRSEFTG